MGDESLRSFLKGSLSSFVSVKISGVSKRTEFGILRVLGTLGLRILKISPTLELFSKSEIKQKMNTFFVFIVIVTVSICKIDLVEGQQGQRTFSCAISTIHLLAGSPYTVCDFPSAGGVSFISTQWLTGTFGQNGGSGCEYVLISLYLDGESTPSLSYYPYQLTGYPSFTAWNSTQSHNVWTGIFSFI